MHRSLALLARLAALALLAGCSVAPPAQTSRPEAAPPPASAQEPLVAPAPPAGAIELPPSVPPEVAPAQVDAAAPPRDLAAEGAEQRVDLRWRYDGDTRLVGYHVYRAEGESGYYRKLTARAHPRHLYSDFVGRNDVAMRYRVTAVRRAEDGREVESPPSATVTATPRAMSDGELMESVQRASFRYFWDFGHPVSGLARERTGSGPQNDTVTSGASGFGLMNIVVGAQRGWVPRPAAAARVLAMLRFLEQADRFHGAWPHWLDGRTGRVIPFSPDDDGGDLVETAFLIQGVLTVRQYFQGSDPVERELRETATRLWCTVEWNWYRPRGEGNWLLWHWSPRVEWKLNHPIGGFNECLIVYLLAVASPTFPVPPELYRKGWAGGGGNYARERTVYGQKFWVGPDLGGPLFFTHYSFLGFDPRGWHDGFCNYFENNRSIARIHHAYAVENPKKFKEYGPLVWGLTASDNPWGYAAQEPGAGDNGTVSPTAALSSMPYVPALAQATLKHFYHQYGSRLWGEFGFRDAFNPGQNWFAESYIGIDQGPIAVMMENHRSQLCWRLFMANPEIEPALKAMGWVRRPAR